MIEVFITKFEKDFIDYVQQTLDIIIPLCQYTTNDTIRHGAAKCLPGLVKACMNNKEHAQKLTRFILELLMKASQEEIDPEVILIQIHAMR